jgi:hypothetical protein
MQFCSCRTVATFELSRSSAVPNNLALLRGFDIFYVHSQTRAKSLTISRLNIIPYSSSDCFIGSGTFLRSRWVHIDTEQT